MSLFSTHELWSAAIGSSEEFNQGTLCVGNIDNEQGGELKIISGSLQGVLRIYFPRGGDYRIEDLMVEQFLGAPILQLVTGNFIPSSKLLALAVLHPRQLVVYQIAAMGGSGKSASYYSVVKAYEHNLSDPSRHFTAGNMVVGPFGSPLTTKDSLCVQSMDGNLQFYEQDHYAFTIQLSDCLVPGPLCYCASSDSIITCNSKREIVAYKYRILASSSGRIEGSRELDWSINIGEYALNIFVSKYSQEQSANDILVLGEHSMFCISEQGEIRMQKRLDYATSACYTYNRGYNTDKNRSSAHQTENLIVATQSKRILIYRDAQLVWAAKNSDVPVAVRVASFGALDGLIVSLTDKGKLSLLYLGTDSPTSPVVTPQGKTVDYAEMDEEYRTLLKDIRFRQKDHGNASAPQILSIRSQVPRELDVLNDDENMSIGDKNFAGIIATDDLGRIRRVSVRLFLAYNGKGKIDNINVSVCPRLPIVAENSVLRIRQLKGGSTPLAVSLKFYLTRGCTPSSRKISIVITYVEGINARTVYHELSLPLLMYAKPILPLKMSDCKFTIESNKEPVQISHLFSTFINYDGAPERIVEKYTKQSANVLTIQYSTGEVATVLVSKNSGKYRMQGSSFQALCLLTKEVIDRLRIFFYEKNEEITFSFSDDFEVQNDTLVGPPRQVKRTVFEYYWERVDKHFFCRQNISNLETALNERGQQFRAIQKRLLVRFKDKNPQPLNHLDTLLSETHKQLVLCSSSLHEERLRLEAFSGSLCCCTELIIILLSLKCALDPVNVQILNAHLTPLVTHVSVQGWEECVDSAMTHLLRTILAKSTKDTSAMPLPITFPDNTVKFKRHFDIVCKRILKKKGF